MIFPLGELIINSKTTASTVSGVNAAVPHPVDKFQRRGAGPQAATTENLVNTTN